MKRILMWMILLYLRSLARLSLSLHKPTVIGIAGSVGKSSTRNAVFAGLKDHVKIMMIPGNSETGIPLGILGLPIDNYSASAWIFSLLKAPFGIFHIKDAKYLIVEMGIDEPFPPRNMEYLLSIVKPDISISLNISATHTEQFEVLLQEKQIGDDEKQEFLLNKLAEEDTKIITQSGCKTAVYNADDVYIKKIIETYRTNNQLQKFLTFGKNPDNTISYTGYKVSTEGTKFDYQIQHQTVSIFFQNMLLPQVYESVFAVALLAGSELSVNINDIAKSLEKNYKLPNSRSSMLEGINNSTIIDSTYNASKSATIPLLNMLHTLKKDTNRPTVFVFGDMRELGSVGKQEHEEVAHALPGIVDNLYLTGPLTKEFVLPIAEKAGMNVKWFKNALELGKFLSENMPNNALVLAKGSQNTIYLEEAVKQILKNKSDASNLCRQSAFWMKKKELSFI